MSIFLASSDSSGVKNENIHTFFFSLLVANFEFAGLTPKQKYAFPWKRSVLQNPVRERANQSRGICLRVGLPYNNNSYGPIINKQIIFKGLLTLLIVVLEESRFNIKTADL